MRFCIFAFLWRSLLEVPLVDIFLRVSLVDRFFRVSLVDAFLRVSPTDAVLFAQDNDKWFLFFFFSVIVSKCIFSVFYK